MNAGCGDASVDSTSMFSHAITVGVHEVEEDYFVAKDESEKKTHNGGGMIDHTEGSSGTYYTFVNLDVASLYEKLTSQGYTKEEVIDLVLVFAKNSILSLPKAKQSTMFGRTLPHYARVTLKPDALVFMRSNPFVKPTYGSDEGMAEETIARLKEYDKEEEAFGIDNFLVKQEISKEGGSMQETLKAVKEKLQEVLP
jgi:CRISPR/Cas system-associated protein Cas7 (RAMP superfamily)